MTRKGTFAGVDRLHGSAGKTDIWVEWSGLRNRNVGNPDAPVGPSSSSRRTVPGGAATMKAPMGDVDLRPSVSMPAGTRIEVEATTMMNGNGTPAVALMTHQPGGKP